MGPARNRVRADTQVGPYRFDRNVNHPKTTGGDRARPLQKDGEYAEGWGDNRPMPVRDLLGFRRPRLPQGTMPGMTAGIPPPAFVPRPNVPRKARSKAPAPVSPKSSVTSRKVSKGRAAALPLVVGGVWGRNRNAPRIFLRGSGGVFFQFGKNTSPDAAKHPWHPRPVGLPCGGTPGRRALRDAPTGRGPPAFDRSHQIRPLRESGTSPPPPIDGENLRRYNIKNP